ncbi:CAMK family protein kinase [Histomonas meleagridis]|nr:CAMK family protein kinase [Histomonas meleagridis]
MFKTFNPLEMQWLPPEYFNGSKSVPNASSDIWSLAALFITMNGMALPWASKNIFTMVRKMLNPSFEVLRDFNSSVLKIMTFSLQADQNKRLRLRQILLEPKPVNNVKRLSIRNWNTQNQINYSTNSLQKNLVPLNSKSKTKMCFRYRKHGCSCLASTRNLSLTKSATFMPIKQALSEPIIGSKKRNEKNVVET